MPAGQIVKIRPKTFTFSASRKPSASDLVAMNRHTRDGEFFTLPQRPFPNFPLGYIAVVDRDTGKVHAFDHERISSSRFAWEGETKAIVG